MSDAPVSDRPAVPVRELDGRQLPAAGTYTLDPVHTHVGFSVKHLMVAKTKGEFAGASADIVIGDDPTDSSVRVTIPAAGISTGDEQRDGHLRSADFLDVDTYPSLTFVSTAVRADGDDWKVDGELTIRDIARPVTLDVEFEGGAVDPWGNAKIGFSAETEIDREDWGLTWNQALEVGGVLIGRKVKISIDAEAGPA